MPNKRSEGKRLIGAQASPELWAGVDEWLSQNRDSTVTDFVLTAILEKLGREGVEIDSEIALRDFRSRSFKAEKSNLALNDQLNSATDAGKNISEQVTSYYAKPGAAKKLPAKKVHPKAKVVPPPAIPPGAP